MPPKRRLGDYYRSGDWSDYWRTSISETYQGVLRIRGYPVQEIVKNLSYAESLYLTIRGELPTKAQARALDAVLTSMLDHQFVSSHAPAARFVASAHSESPVPGIAAGILCAGTHTISPTGRWRFRPRKASLLRRSPGGLWLSTSRPRNTSLVLGTPPTRSLTPEVRP